MADDKVPLSAPPPRKPAAGPPDTVAAPPRPAEFPAGGAGPSLPGSTPAPPGDAPVGAPNQRPPRVWLAFVAAAVTPVILVVAEADMGSPWLAVAAFLPVALALDPDRWLRSWALLGFCAGAVTALTTLWIALYGKDFDNLILPASAYAAVVLGLPAALCCRAARSRRAPVTGLLALPAGWVLGEILGRRYLLGLTWALVGLPLVDWPWAAPAVAFAGPEILSGLALAVPVSLALLIRRAPRWAVAAGLLQGPVLLGALAAWGMLGAGREPAKAPLLPVALIQPNFKQGEEWTPEVRDRRLELLDRLIDETRLTNPALIVLPESAVNGYVRYDDVLTEWVKSVVTRTRRPLLFGSLDEESPVSGPSNVAVLIRPDGNVTTYRKNRLVAVSEWLPEVGPFYPWLVALRGGTDEFTPGVEPTFFELPGGPRFAAPICYEDVLPDLARSFALAGARLLIPLVNTERFNETSQPDLHLRRARLTALAVGLPMLRCTNSGVTCQVAPDGRVVALLKGANGRDRGFAAAAVFAVPLRSRSTTYRRFGDKLPLSLCAGLVLTFAAAGRFLGAPRTPPGASAGSPGLPATGGHGPVSERD